MNCRRFGVLILGISQLNQTYLIAGLDSKFIFCNNDEILLLIVLQCRRYVQRRASRRLFGYC